MTNKRKGNILLNKGNILPKHDTKLPMQERIHKNLKKVLLLLLPIEYTKVCRNENSCAEKYNRKEERRKLLTSEKNSAFYLVGLLNEFMNNFQAAGDQFFEEISWKQCFVLICIQLFQAPPTIRKIAELQGSSHQNIKQMLLKLERSGYIYFIKDEKDLRKQRIQITEKTKQFSQKYDKASTVYMEELFAPVSREELKITIETISKLDGQLRKIRESRNERGKQGISEEQFYQLKKRTVL